MASSHIARVTAGGVSDRRIAHSLYGKCNTLASTVAKVVNVYTGSGTTADGTWAAADLFHGLMITVKFENSNTAENPTLNVNSSGAKPIYLYGTQTPGNTPETSWQQEQVISFVYDTELNASGCWVMTGSAGGSGQKDKLAAYQITVGDGTNTSFVITHDLDNQFILVSVSITDNNTTYIANRNMSAGGLISYGVVINSANQITINFSQAPALESAKVSIVSTNAYVEAIDNLLLLEPEGDSFLKV